MMDKTRNFNIDNIDSFLSAYEQSFAQIGSSIQGMSGHSLLVALKRKHLEEGPYPGVTLFEAANRIMSDLVILHGVRSILRKRLYPFDEYRVELGHENNNAFDIMASNGTEELVGEAFNVSNKFFASKKNAAIKKLREKAVSPDFRILMFNHEAVRSSYAKVERRGVFCPRRHCQLCIAHRAIELN
jgi:hypothetical protein